MDFKDIYCTIVQWCDTQLVKFERWLEQLAKRWF